MIRSKAGTLAWLSLAACMAWMPHMLAADLPEYRLKAAFVYKVMRFTQWPANIGETLNLCLYGGDPFGSEIDDLRGRMIDGRHIAVHRKAGAAALGQCQVVFVTAAAIDRWGQIASGLHGQPLLTVADSPGALRLGIVVNMALVDHRVTFEASQKAARSAGLSLSSRLLSLATTVQ